MESDNPRRRGRPWRTWRRQVQAGYSLYDLILTTGISGALGVGAVGMASLVQDARLTTTINQIMGDLNLSRSEAIKRNAHVVLCKSGDGATCSRELKWNQGWIIFADENKNNAVDAGEALIRAQQSLDGKLDLRYGETGSYYYVRYNPSGEAWPGATFSVCDARGAAKAKAVIVYWTGRPRVSTKNSEGQPLRCT